MVVLGEKLGGRSVDRPADMLRIVSRAIFLRSSRVRLTMLGQRERLPRTGIVREKRTSGVCGPVQKNIRIMCIRFFPTWCISIQIIVTLGYE
jgi:hypothetical protein